jgi:transglutaminase-like putative cysteine protease
MARAWPPEAPLPSAGAAIAARHRGAARRHRRALAAAAAAAAVILVAGLAIAQRPRRVLHQELPATGAKPSPIVGDTRAGNPAAFQAGNKLLSEPSGAARPGEPVFGKGGLAADRQTAMTPDTQTGSDGTLHYVSVFNPDVIPFKRMSVFDRVTDAQSYQLVVASGPEAPVPVGGASDDRTRDRFWGSVLLELAPGQAAPLPSVAPDMRILSYEVTPRVELEFSRDRADNFFVRAPTGAAGTYRLVFLADADAGYFAPALPTGRRLTPREVAATVPLQLRRPLPADVRTRAMAVLRRLGLDDDMELGVVMNKLIAHHRAFEAKPLATRAGGPPDLYRELSEQQAGVCRHRSFAFMISASALGLPTRYVENEAHAFVEVWLPERGWQRIDLGGAAMRMDVTGANDKTLHRPRAEDPFAQPPQYRDTYTQLSGEISGLTREQLADKRAPLDRAPASGQFPAADAGTEAGSGSPAPPSPRISPDRSLPAADRDPALPTPRLVVTGADPTAYRGGTVRIEGRAEVAGKGVPDHVLEVYLEPNEPGPSKAIWIGVAKTGPDGTFRAELEIPRGVAASTHKIYLSASRTADYNAALSD